MTRARTAYVPLLEAAEACPQVYGVTEELGSAHITPQRSTSSSSSSHTRPSVHSVLPTLPPSLCGGSIYRAALTTLPPSVSFTSAFPPPKGQVCSVNAAPSSQPLFFSPPIPSSRLVFSFLEGKVLRQGLRAQSVSHVSGAWMSRLPRPCRRARMLPGCFPAAPRLLPGCSPPAHSNQLCFELCAGCSCRPEQSETMRLCYRRAQLRSSSCNISST